MELITDPLSKLAQYGIAGVGIVAIVAPLGVLVKTQMDSNKLVKEINEENNAFNQNKGEAMIEHINAMTKMFTDVVINHLGQEKQAIQELINSNKETQRSNEQANKTLEKMLASVERLISIYDYNQKNK